VPPEDPLTVRATVIRLAFVSTIDRQLAP